MTANLIADSLSRLADTLTLLLLRDFHFYFSSDMSNRTKVVLIGAGGWGDQHARILDAHPDVEFAAVCGRTEEKTRLRAEKYGVRHYQDIDEMLESEKPDLVHISLPNTAHFEPTLKVIKAGYPIFAEKPLVYSMEEANILIEEAAQRRLWFGINFNHHYSIPYQKAYQAIQDNRLGQICHATWKFTGGRPGDDDDFTGLIAMQSHGFNTLEHLCGPISSVMTEFSEIDGRRHNSMSISLKFENGAIGALIGSNDSSYRYPKSHYQEIIGSKGRIWIEDTAKRYEFNSNNSETSEIWEAGYFNDGDRQFRATFDKHYDEALKAFRAGKEPPVHANCGRRALELAMACIESWKTGRRIKV